MSLSQDDLFRGQIISQLMCNFRVDLTHIAKPFHLNIDTYLHNELAQLQVLSQLDVLTLEANKVSVNQDHRPFIFQRHLKSE